MERGRCRRRALSCCSGGCSLLSSWKPLCLHSWQNGGTGARWRPTQPYSKSFATSATGFKASFSHGTVLLLCRCEDTLNAVVITLMDFWTCCKMCMDCCADCHNRAGRVVRCDRSDTGGHCWALHLHWGGSDWRPPPGVLRGRAHHVAPGGPLVHRLWCPRILGGVLCLQKLHIG